MAASISRARKSINRRHSMTIRKTSFRMNQGAAALVSAGLLAATGSARADQLGDLQAAVQQLQAQIDELKAQRAADAQKAAAAPAVVVNPPPTIPAVTDLGLGAALVPVPRLLQIKTAGGQFM